MNFFLKRSCGKIFKFFKIKINKVYSSVLTEADEATFQKVIELHNTSDLQEEKMRIAQALGAVKDEKLIKKVLEFSISVS